MATLTDALTTGLWTVGAELSVLHASGVAGGGLTGPDLLADAAVVLPVSSPVLPMGAALGCCGVGGSAGIEGSFGVDSVMADDANGLPADL